MVKKFLQILCFVLVFGFLMSNDIYAKVCCQNNDSGKYFEAESEEICNYVNSSKVNMNLCKENNAPYVDDFSRPSTWQKPTVEEFGEEAYDENPNSGNQMLYSVNGIMASLGDSIIPIKSEEGKLNTGAVSFFTNNIAFMVAQPPAKTATYIADVAEQAGFAQPAYAQGTGWDALNPVLNVWKAFRNMAYLLFVVVFVVIGFMIMFRSKIGGQTVVTIQAALPKIIITLLLITFSYAIAALALDLIYVLIYFILGIFKTFEVINDLPTAKKMILGTSIFGNWNELMGIGKEGIAGNAAESIRLIIEGLLENSPLGGKILGYGAQALTYLIFAIAILISIFKMFFKLLMAYVSIIVSVIFAPITLLFNAMPGSQGFGKWFKGLMANALLFPITAVMILITAGLTGSEHYGVSDFGYNNAKNYNKIGLPFIMGGVNTGAILPLISIGFLMLMPSVLEMVQKMMGVEGGVAGMAQTIFAPIQTAVPYATAPIREPFNAYMNVRSERDRIRQQTEMYRDKSAADAILNQPEYSQSRLFRKSLLNQLLGKK